MSAKETSSTSRSFISRIKDAAALTKLRLSLLVVVSAVLSYFLAGGVASIQLVYLIVGGALITGASNGLNQVIERETDKLMTRTQNRPLPRGRMTVVEATVLSCALGGLGLLLLFQINFFSGVLGLLAIMFYVGLYTPLKKVSPLAVFVGAFPGAIPPMIGVVAVSGAFNLLAGTVFLVQFIWQFPHFWAIAWVKDDDYAKADFSLLPLKTRKSKQSAFLIVLYAVFMVPIGALPWALSFTGQWSLTVSVLTGLWFFAMAYRLYLRRDDQSARQLMFSSFIYLPVIQLTYVLDTVSP